MRKYLHVTLCLTIVLSGCSRYSSQQAVEDGHVVAGPDGMFNVGKLDQFYESYLDHKEVEIRIVHYTEEGDPIYLDLISDGKNVQFSRDNSDDKHGGKKKGKKTTVCNQMLKKVGSRGDTYGVEYALKDCRDDIGYSDVANKEYFLLFVEGVRGG